MSSRLGIWSQRQPDKASRQCRCAVTACPGVFPFCPSRPTSREKRTWPRPWPFPRMRTRTRRNWLDTSTTLVHAHTRTVTMGVRPSVRIVDLASTPQPDFAALHAIVKSYHGYSSVSMGWSVCIHLSIFFCCPQ